MGVLTLALALAAQAAAANQSWTVVSKTNGTVLSTKTGHQYGIQSGFEGGDYFRTADGIYHYFATEMLNTGATMWVGTRGGQ